MKYTKWTNKQMVRLRKHYPTMTKQELIIEFAPHSWGSIKMTAQRNRFAGAANARTGRPSAGPT
jgi:hypothetical protein